MKRKHYFSLAALIGISALAVAVYFLGGKYYYSLGKRIYVQQRSDLVAFHIPSDSLMNTFMNEGTQFSSNYIFENFQLRDSLFNFSNQSIVVMNKNEVAAFEKYFGSGFSNLVELKVAKNKLAEVPMLIDGAVLFRFKDGTSDKLMKEVLEKYIKGKNVTVTQSQYFKERYVIEPNDELDPFRISKSLFKHDSILYAHPNFIFNIIEHNSSNCGRCISLHSVDAVHNNYHHEILGTKTLIQKGISGDSTVKIAVLDDAILVDHPYFSHNASGNHYSTVPGNDNDPSPKRFADCHGTPVAGLALGNSNDASFYGTCPDCRLVGVQVFGSIWALIRVVEKLIESEKVSVINMSWEMHCYVDGAIHALTEDTRKGRGGKGIAVCMSAGNLEGDICNNRHLQNEEYLLAIGSTSRDDKATKKGNGDCLDIAAPGYGIYSPGYSDDDTNGDVLCAISATSAAAPIVSGIIGLMIAENPSISFKAIKNILKNTAYQPTEYIGGGAVAYDNGHNKHIGFGRVDAIKALLPNAVISIDADLVVNVAAPFNLNINCIYGIKQVTINGGYTNDSPIVFPDDTYSIQYTNLSSLKFSTIGTQQVEIDIEDLKGSHHIFNQEIVVN